MAHFYDEHGASTETLPLADVSPTDLFVLDLEIAPQGNQKRVSLHLEDQSGLDRGAFGEVSIRKVDSLKH